MCKIRNIGEAPIPVSRPPENGDYVFTRPTEINYVAMAVWGAIPNMQFFWLLDAVSQNRPVPGRYLVTAAAYGGCQIVAFLALAVLLFQRRDVG
jgi:ABC-2 type transport system permease protein